MAYPTGSHATYNEPQKTGGNREDLSDILFDVSPVETPVLTMLGKCKATGKTHEWLTDALKAAASNVQLEGGDVTGVASESRSRLANNCQIMGKFPVVTGTQEVALKGGGVKSEMSLQMAKALKEIKRDGELAIVGVSNVKVVGAATVGSELASLDAYVTTNAQLAATSSSATGDGTDVSDYAGTNRAITEAILEAALQSIFTNSGGNTSINCVTTAASKGLISDFTGAGTRFTTVKEKELSSSIDVYEGDFHTVRIIPDRHCKTGLTFIIDPEYAKVAEYRAAHSFDLAKTGDSHRKAVIWEWTLQVGNEKAHALLGDLTT